jgi:hypothetical protein
LYSRRRTVTDGMSESEYERQYALCNDVRRDDDYERVTAPKAPAGYWRVRGGALLEIRKMTTDHLKNAINLFTNIGHGDHAKIKELREELKWR